MRRLGTGGRSEGRKDTVERIDIEVLLATLHFAYVIALTMGERGERGLGKSKGSTLLTNRSAKLATEWRQRSRFHPARATKRRGTAYPRRMMDLLRAPSGAFFGFTLVITCG